MPRQSQKVGGDTTFNKGRCYVCGIKDTVLNKDGKVVRNPDADRNNSNFCRKPGGAEELWETAAKVQSYVDCLLPKRPDGQDPKVPKEERSRSKSRPRHGEQPQPQRVVEKAWAYGEEISRQSKQIMKLLKSGRVELHETGEVSKELQNILRGIVLDIGQMSW